MAHYQRIGNMGACSFREARPVLRAARRSDLGERAEDERAHPCRAGAGRGWLHDPGSRPPPPWRAREPPTPFRPKRMKTTVPVNDHCLQQPRSGWRRPASAVSCWEAAFGLMRGARTSRGGPSAGYRARRGRATARRLRTAPRIRIRGPVLAIDRRGAPCDAPTSAPSCPSSRRW